MTHSAPTRRAVVLATGAALWPLSACGVRLEDDAPDIPFVPTRDPVPGEAALLTVLSATGHQDDPRAAERADQLAGALAQLRVPEADVTAARQAPRASSIGEDISAHETALRSCPSELVPLVGRLCTVRLHLGERDLWAPTTEQQWTATQVAADAAASTRAAIWGLTVARAKGDAQLRRTIEQDVELLERLRTRQVTAGADSGGDAPLGYELDQPVGTAAEARQLAGAVLSRLAGAYVALFAGLGEDRAAAHELVTWTADVLSRGAGRGLIVPGLPVELS